jgi:hypothetical protein
MEVNALMDIAKPPANSLRLICTKEDLSQTWAAAALRACKKIRRRMHTQSFQLDKIVVAGVAVEEALAPLCYKQTLRMVLEGRFVVIQPVLELQTQ